MEWLTSYESLEELLSPHNLFKEKIESSIKNEQKADISLSVFHVGCGTSDVGSSLVKRYPDFYKYVLNVDNDAEFILEMQEKEIESNEMKSEYLQLDLDDESMCEKELSKRSKNGFDLVIDKSTLDCMLCAESTACGLLTQIYNNLKWDGTGVYFLITYHSRELILSLLNQNNIMKWKSIDCIRLNRSTENLKKDCCKNDIGNGQLLKFFSNKVQEEVPNRKCWLENGMFEPCSNYAQTVNVFICRKDKILQIDDNYIDVANFLTKEKVKICVEKALNEWYQQDNPMMTPMRATELRYKFRKKLDVLNLSKLSLSDAYLIMFTDSEKEHLPYEYFLEDWTAYAGSNKNEMDVEEAIKFVEEMQ